MQGGKLVSVLILINCLEKLLIVYKGEKKFHADQIRIELTPD